MARGFRRLRFIDIYAKDKDALLDPKTQVGYSQKKEQT
jgi:hypothetical protein